jgi:hypothetical protein
MCEEDAHEKVQRAELRSRCNDVTRLLNLLNTTVNMHVDFSAKIPLQEIVVIRRLYGFCTSVGMIRTDSKRRFWFFLLSRMVFHQGAVFN